jgi:polyhydroxybutyrate depolymerase
MWRTASLALAVAVTTAVIAAMPLPARADMMHVTTMHVTTAQGAREAIVLASVPTPAPTVIVLHGATATAAMTARTSGFAEAAAARGFAAVFPQGVYRQWNDGREDGRISTIDDVGFLRQLVHELVQRGIADRRHIYLAGISNGGMMTFRMLCEASELFAGAATIIANMPAGIGERCQVRKPQPLVMFNGTADPLVPYEGGPVGFAGQRGLVWRAERTADFMARVNGCAAMQARPLPVETSNEIVQVARLAWAPCRAGGPVTLYRLENGGHQVPGRPEVLPRLLGLGSLQINAAEEAIRTFTR